jgi:hypothetical protein
MLRPDAPAPPATRANNNTFDPQKRLIRFSREGDYLTSERMEEHILVIGATHSSKSSATMRLLMESAMASGAGVFVHSAKISAAWDAMDAAKRAGCKRIIDYSPGSGERFSWADYEYQDFGDGKGRVDNLMSVFNTMVEVTMRSSGQKESEPFWAYMQSQGMTNLLFIDGEANGSIDVSRILAMWQSIPQGFGDLEDLQRLLSVATLIEAEKKCPPEKRRALALAKNWLVRQMPALSERTRSCVEAMAIGMLDAHARDIMQEAMGGKSTWTPEDLEAGAVVVCGYDVMRYGGIGKLIQVGCKKSIQRFVGRRLARFRGRLRECCPIIIVADEAGFFIDSGDQEYLRTSREGRGGCVWAIQSIPSVVDELGGGAVAENKVKATLGMFQTKIYHYNDCDVTNEQSARWIGQDMQRRPGGSIGTDSRGKVNRGESWSEQPYFLVPPIAFQQALPRGGEAEKWNVRAFVTMAGHKWKCNDGKHWAKIKLFQSCTPGDGFDVGYPWAPIWMFLEKVATARQWAFHRSLREVWSAWRKETSEGKPWEIIRRWWAFWIDDRETLLGGGHE